MNAPASGGRLAALCLLLAAPCAHALVVSSQYFSTTGNFSGNYAPLGVPSHAFWSVAQTTDPLAVAWIDVTVSGSVTFVEANPWNFALGWTPTLGVNLNSAAPGYAQGTNFNVTGAYQLIPANTPPANSRDGTPATLTFSVHFSGLVTGAALDSYLGSGATYFNSTAVITPLEQYGRYSGTVTHTGRITFNASESGGALALLGGGLALLIGIHRRRSTRSLLGV